MRLTYLHQLMMPPKSEPVALFGCLLVCRPVRQKQKKIFDYARSWVERHNVNPPVLGCIILCLVKINHYCFFLLFLRCSCSNGSSIHTTQQCVTTTQQFFAFDKKNWTESPSCISSVNHRFFCIAVLAMFRNILMKIPLNSSPRNRSAKNFNFVVTLTIISIWMGTKTFIC